MAVKSSGPLSIEEIATEFDGGRPHSLSEYYRNGGRVPDSSLNTNIPTTGAISVSNFYSSSKFYSETLEIPGLDAINYANACSGQNTTNNTQPNLDGVQKSRYYRTFKGLGDVFPGTQITVPNLTIRIRGDKAGGKNGNDDTAYAKDPGVQIFYRSTDPNTSDELVASYRGSGQSSGENYVNVSVEGGTYTATKAGFYWIRYVMTSWSSDAGDADWNRFTVGDWTLSIFGSQTLITSVGTSKTNRG